MIPSTPAAPRPSRRTRTTPVSAGLPDPRPLTDYTAVYSEVDDHSRITVTLDQPCVIRSPQWRFIDGFTGQSIAADSTTVVGNAQILFDFEGFITETFNFIEVPYQDTQVQNFQGGFVRPGARWFRPI